MFEDDNETWFLDAGDSIIEKKARKCKLPLPYRHEGTCTEKLPPTQIKTHEKSPFRKGSMELFALQAQKAVYLKESASSPRGSLRLLGDYRRRPLPRRGRMLGQLQATICREMRAPSVQ
jgi:hypothetical protein